MDLFNVLSTYQNQAIQTLVVILLYLFSRFAINFAIQRRMLSRSFGQDRMILVRRVLRFLILIFFGIVFASIWGVKQGDIFLFLTSVLTVIGIGFFAQWSILSNITAGLILFFSNDIRRGNNITIFEKDVEISGTVQEIGLVFFLIETKDRGMVSIPNTLILQKMIALNQPSSK